MSRKAFEDVLKKYLPGGTVEICVSWILQKNIHLKITKGRSSRYGDYRPMEKGKGHRISVNHDLNPYAFLITFVHEVAHLNCFVKYRHTHLPHGIEWKTEFRFLLNEFILQKVFPPEIESALLSYVRDPAASSCSDMNLVRALKKYDHGSNNAVHLEDLPYGALFRLNGSRAELIFRKEHKLRTRFNCVEIHSGKVYWVSPAAEVVEHTFKDPATIVGAEAES